MYHYIVVLLIPNSMVQGAYTTSWRQAEPTTNLADEFLPEAGVPLDNYVFFKGDFQSTFRYLGTPLRRCTVSYVLVPPLNSHIR